MDISSINEQTGRALKELLEAAKLKEKQILVIGCSTSEVAGKKIGTSGSLEIAQAILETIYPVVKEKGLFLAIQCCEHLNRALVVEEEILHSYTLEQVAVVPVQKAGGSLATVAMNMFHEPILVESIQAHGGLDIGDTFIGMHLRPVVVPVRASIKNIGNANLTMARTRPKLIGGERAVYC